MGDIAKYSDKGFVTFCGIVTDRVEEGECEAHCEVSEQHLNPWGIGHGGLAFTMLDTTAGKAVRSLSDNSRNLVTLSSNVSYLRPVKPGRVYSRAHVIKDGRTIAVAESGLYDEEGRLLVRASFEFFYV